MSELEEMRELAARMMGDASKLAAEKAEAVRLLRWSVDTFDEGLIPSQGYVEEARAFLAKQETSE